MGWGRGTKVFLGLSSLETPPPHPSRPLVTPGWAGGGDGSRDSVSKAGRALLPEVIECSGTASPSPCSGLSAHTHSFAWTLGQAQLKSLVGRGGVGTWRECGLALPCPRGHLILKSLKWPWCLKSEVSFQHALLVGTGKPPWISWPFSSFSSFWSQVMLGPR